MLPALLCPRACTRLSLLLWLCAARWPLPRASPLQPAAQSLPAAAPLLILFPSEPNHSTPVVRPCLREPRLFKVPVLPPPSYASPALSAASQQAHVSRRPHTRMQQGAAKGRGLMALPCWMVALAVSCNLCKYYVETQGKLGCAMYCVMYRRHDESCGMPHSLDRGPEPPPPPSFLPPPLATSWRSHACAAADASALFTSSIWWLFSAARAARRLPPSATALSCSFVSCVGVGRGRGWGCGTASRMERAAPTVGRSHGHAACPPSSPASREAQGPHLKAQAGAGQHVCGQAARRRLQLGRFLHQFIHQSQLQAGRCLLRWDGVK